MLLALFVLCESLNILVNRYVFVNLCRDVLSSAPDVAVWEVVRLPRGVYSFPFTSFRVRMTRGEGLAMTKAGRGTMPRGLNKQSYVSQPPGGEVIKDYYLVPAPSAVPQLDESP
jgi:hypothetical protein